MAAQDFAPWDPDYAPVLAGVRARLLLIAGVNDGTHACLPLQGSGHFGVEAALRTFVPHGGKVLVPMTGAYARRLVRLAKEAGREVVEFMIGEEKRADPAAVRDALAGNRDISHLAFVYSETGTGIIHDAASLAEAARAEGRRVIIDAVSAFGALPLDLAAMPETDAAVFTPNKCLEGLPGLVFVIAPKERLRACHGQAESWCLDLADVYARAEQVGTGRFRFTPPVQAISALAVALDLYAAEGGRPARLKRYQEHLRAFYDGVLAIGLTPALPRTLQGPIVINVLAPDDPRWDLQRFVALLKQHGFLISNWYNTKLPSFRVGLMGALKPEDYRAAASAIDGVLGELGIHNRKAA